jgi:hypothetical protein
VAGDSRRLVRCVVVTKVRDTGGLAVAERALHDRVRPAAAELIEANHGSGPRPAVPGAQVSTIRCGQTPHAAGRMRTTSIWSGRTSGGRWSIRAERDISLLIALVQSNCFGLETFGCVLAVAAGLRGLPEAWDG